MIVGDGPLEDLLDRSAAKARQLGRDDLGRRLDAALRRVADRTVEIFVVGEFKQGKSSLINALVATDVCPVDDDVATAVPTMVRFAEAEVATVLSPGPPGAEPSRETVRIADVAGLVSEAANPGNARRVWAVEVGLPAPFLAEGFVLVDTPGVGGLGSTHSITTTFTALPYVDGVLFVSDASQEYTEPEMSFLRLAKETWPNVVAVLTKIDLYPEWRRIRELDRGHLRAAGLDDEVIATSAVLERAGHPAESGYPELIEALRGKVARRAASLKSRWALEEVASVLQQVEGVLRAESGSLAGGDGPLEELARAAARAERLTGEFARWERTLDDGVEDIEADAEEDIEARLERVRREADDQIAAADPRRIVWSDLADSVHQQAAEALNLAYLDINENLDGLAERVADDLSAEGAEVAVPADMRASTAVLEALSLGALSRSPVAGAPGSSTARGLRTRLGVEGLVTAALAIGVSAVNPLAAAGGIFKGIQAVQEERGRDVDGRRESARRVLTRAIDDATRAAKREMRRLLRDRHDELKDAFLERATELSRSARDALAAATRAAQTSAADRAVRSDEVDAELEVIANLAAAAAQLDAEVGDG